MSCPTDLSPTTLFSLGADRWVTARVSMGWGGGVPGVWEDWVGREGYTGTQPSPVPGPVFKDIPQISPTYGQMKAILRVS